MDDFTTVAVRRSTLALIEAIADKRSKQLGFHIGKGDVVQNLVVAEARAMGLRLHQKPTKMKVKKK
jgi:hypothetical protein